MALSNVTPVQVYTIIGHEDFSVFHRLMKKELGIEDMDYRFATGELAEGDEGYVDIRTNARANFLESWEGVEKITFFGEGLSRNVNLKFTKLPREALLAAAEICIKFALVHELVHVRQFKAGVLTKQKKEELQQVPYEKRDIEIEANTIAKEILNRYGKYNVKVLEIFTSNESIDEISLPEITRLFEEQYITETVF